MRRCLVSAIAVLLLSIYTSAQGPATGFPPYGSFDQGNFDTVNLFDLNFGLAIPIVHTHGRGIDFNFSVGYNSLNWIVSGGAWTPMTNSNFGWLMNSPTGQDSYRLLNGRSRCGFIDGFPYYTYTTTYDTWKYVDPFGTVHPFNVNWEEVNNTCTGSDTISGTFTGYATDGSGFYADVSNAPSSTMITPAGIEVSSSGMTDTNANSITSSNPKSGETDWTDSAGHTALKAITGASSIQYEYYDSSGNLQTATVNLETLAIKTNFGCSGVIEYSGSATVPQSIALPNNQSYGFLYEPTPGQSGYYTGRLQQVNLPTGGTIQYTYGGSNDGINCSDGSIINFTRTVNNGTDPPAAWQYSRWSLNPGWETNVLTPKPAYASSGGETLITFNASGQETQRQINDYTGQILRTIATTWASNGTPATRIVFSGNLQSETETTFDSFGNLGLLKEHDWGSGAPGPVVRTTTIYYLNAAPYNTTANILDRPTSIRVEGSNGIVQSYAQIAYDQSGYINANCIPNTNCTWTYRGDPTSVTKYANAVNETGPVTLYSTYDSAGNVVKSTVDCCQQKQWLYSATTNYSYPDSETDGPSGGTQMKTSFTYSSSDGQLLSVTDPNNHATSFAYDLMKRVKTVTRPDNTQVTYNYIDATPPAQSQVMVTTPVQGTNSIVQTTNFDGLARPVQTMIQDAGNNTYSVVQTQYDPLGRAYKVSNPYTGSPQYWTETDYDALDRTTKVILPDSSQTTYAYAANSVTVTDPAGKQREILTDALGRTSGVYEPDPANNNSLTNLTSYAYTVMDDLASVTEGSQTRTYNYDGLGNLLSATTPEAGTLQYSYNDFGLVTQRTDARNAVTNYSYDSLNRLTGISYTLPQGSQVAQMPNICNPLGGTAVDNVCFYYDEGGTGANALGQLTHMTFALGNQTNPPTGTDTYSYDLLGRTTQLQDAIGGQTYTIGYQYNNASELTTVTYPSGRTVQQAYDPIGRLCEIAPQTSACGNSPSPYATGYGYNAAFEVTGFNDGNGVSAAFGYSANRLQLTTLAYAKGTSTLFSLAYGYGSTGSNDGQMQGITDNVDNGRSASYVYDALGRITSATTTGSTNYAKWGMAWTYDRYGNRLTQSATAGTVPTNSVSVNAATNQINSTGYGYDASGNMTNDALNTLTYDAENRVVSASGSLGAGSYVYDGNGLRVEKTVSGATMVYVFSGTKTIAEYASGAAPSSPSTEYIYSGSSLLAKISGSTTTYVHTDHLSARLLTNSFGSVVGQQGHFPYGESWYTQNTTTKWQFTSYERDAESDNDYALARSYVNRLACFSSPDPIVASAIDNPQTWGRYAYVTNDPVNLADELGMAPPSTTSLTCQQLAAGQKPKLGLVSWLKGAIGANAMFDLWEDGVGPTNYDFGPTSVQSQEMLSAYGMAQNISNFLGGGTSSSRQDFGRPGLIASGTNPTAQFVGSYDWSMSLSGGYLNVTITNTTTAWSFFDHSSLFNPNPPTRTGWHPMGRVNQTFHLTIPCKPSPTSQGTGGGSGDSPTINSDEFELLCLFFTGDFGCSPSSHPEQKQ